MDSGPADRCRRRMVIQVEDHSSWGICSHCSQKLRTPAVGSLRVYEFGQSSLVSEIPLCAAHMAELVSQMFRVAQLVYTPKEGVD